jgi:hypothetical protein
MIIVDDNFVDENTIAKIEHLITGWNNQPIGWVFAPASNTENEDGGAIIDKNVFEHPMFVAVLTQEHQHPLRKEIISLAESFFRKNKILFSEILRIKINIVPMAPLSSYGKYQMPHIDTDRDHKVFLYYVNDADGDTILFNEMKEDGKPTPTKFTEKRRVTPKRGRGLVFDGSNYHAPTAPVSSIYRCVINIDFV